METSLGTTNAQISDALWQGLPHPTDLVSLQDQNFGKQSQGIVIQTQDKKDHDQKYNKCTTRQATQTQPVLLSVDTPFVAVLGTVPTEDWCRTWVTDRTIMLRMTLKRVKEVVDKIRLPVVVRLNRSFWDDTRNVTSAEKIKFTMRQLTLMTSWCHISTLELT